MVGAAAVALSLVGSAYLLVAGLQVRRFRASTAKLLGDLPPVTVLKPLCGADPGLEQALATVVAQDYPGRIQVVFGLQDAGDPALAVVQRLQHDHPKADVTVVVDSRMHGSNRKVSNLINMMTAAEGDIVVLADSDIFVTPDYLRRVVAPLADPAVGVVTCAYTGRPLAGLWSELAAMQISYQFLPSIAVGLALGLAHPCMGSTIALRRDVLQEIGGFAAFKDILADDYAIGEAVRRTGRQSRVSDLLVTHGCAEANARALLAHELRWARTIRGIDPAGFFGSVVTHAVVWGLIATALLHGAQIAVAGLAVAVVVRLWMMRQVANVSAAGPWRWWLMPGRDILSFAIYLGSFFVRVVEWRGARFRVDPRGGLTRV
jgi:ceramide glucosyltransferase